ncbi:MAG: PrsW family intramembrane metalloprotease [Chlorobi bacterium]|nr:PrsW family intramembrane metalloprotease [Chlorobiota bacterium]
MHIVIVAFAPVFIIAFYVYFRDKYEKEPVQLLIKSLISGAVIVIPVIYLEKFTGSFSVNFDFYKKAAYNAFIVAAFSEELFKYMALYYLIWRNKNFNEKFDGIVYAVFISLGFAAVENLKYIINFGVEVGYTRAFTAVPAHALFGVTMGFYFGMAKFYPQFRSKYLFLSLLIPIVLHGIYDFILMAQFSYTLLIFLPFIYYLWRSGLKKMNELSDVSVFKT